MSFQSLNNRAMARTITVPVSVFSLKNVETIFFMNFLRGIPSQFGHAQVPQDNFLATINTKKRGSIVHQRLKKSTWQGRWAHRGTYFSFFG